MSDILYISDDIVGSRMAGPGIRAWETARSLSRRFAVKLAVPGFARGAEDEAFFRGAPLEMAFYKLGDAALIRQWAEACRIVLFQGFVLSKFPVLKNHGRYLIADIYDPFVLENLFIHQRKAAGLAEREAVHLHDLRVFNDILLAADYFVCASERQKDLFAGALMSLNRITPRALDADPALASLITVVPFGLSEGGPRRDGDAGRSALAEEFSEIGENDILLLWGGVLSNWFDPLTLLRGFAAALPENPRLKLLFLSSVHPNPLLPPFEAAADARSLAEELGLLGRSVFFREGWVPYDRRAAYFERADIGLSVHRTHFETRYAFRTRILDYINFGVPIVCTEGDYFAGLVAEEGLGLVVRPEKPDDIRTAILRLAEDAGLRARLKANLGKVRERFVWDRVTEPLARHCGKVLAGEVRTGEKPGRREIAYICGGVADSAIRRGGKKLLGNNAAKVPTGLAARIRRLLRF
ncbi:MAG: glycosyltransferase family 4 protein [Candidatus Aminicenantes bacterium]|nr:glycosyltransferase family 4 protein [Candidatus Aminicenantes bacterium]